MQVLQASLRMKKSPRACVCHFALAAFTLIELLVVIAIIAVLAGLSFPVVGGMLDRGADAQDLSNLRKIGTAISQFAAENNNRWPNASIPLPGDSQGRSSFMEHVDRYFEPDSRFSASSIYNWQRRPVWYSKRFAEKPSSGSFNANSQYYWGTAWGLNQHLWGSTNTNISSFDGRILKAPDVSKLVLVGEKNRNGGHDFKPDDSPVFERNVEASYRVSRPNQRAYYLFGDYRVESIAGDQSTKMFPQYRRYSPTNALYYRWW